MRERPILFSAPMVRALLAGTKTQTRRVVKEPISGWLNNANGSHKVLDGQVFNYSFDEPLGTCPYGQPGDRLWVREAFRFAASLDRLSPNDVGEKALDAGYNTPWAPTQFEADGRRAGAWHGFDTPPTVTTPGKLRPGIHMPRWVCRLVLEITGVRVERLNDISEEDADAECFGGDYPTRVLPELFPGHPDDWSHLSIEQCFQRLWESINGAGSWQANPWVWVVEFRVLHPRTDGGGREPDPLLRP